MLKLLFAVCITLGSNLALATDFWTEVQMTRAKGVAINQVNAGLMGGSGTVGYYAFGQSTSTGYQQLYAGPKVNPTDWLEAGIAIGAERISSSDWMKRTAGYVWAGKGNFSLLGVYEDGGTGPWRKMLLNYKVTPDLSIGIQNQSYLGTGVRAEYSFGKNLSVWGTVLKNEIGTTTQVALKIKF